MKIGVVSDTHSLDVPKEVIKGLKETDLIIHAGDFCTKEDFEVFRKCGELKAVHGNMDDSWLHKKLPETQWIDVEQITIGIYHGHGPARKIIDAVRSKMDREPVDTVVFGHSHQAFNEVIDGRLYFNPGSPTDTIIPDFCSFGILTVEGKNIRGEIIKV